MSKFHLKLTIPILVVLGAGFYFVTDFAGAKNCSGPDRTCWQRAVDVSNPGPSLSNYQVKITLDTATLISRRKMRSDCGDLRVTDVSGTNPISHWIENGCNSTSTNIWVKIPSLASDATETLYMRYGNPSLTSADDFNNTFPSRYVLTSGSDTAAGSQSYDWFEVQKGAIFNTQKGTVQKITARKIIIAGTVDGSGRGFDGAATLGSGQGLGAGSYKSGAGYGGVGGRGQTSAWGLSGTPGSVYGDISSGEIQLGSGGGASDNIQAPGGDGGGAVIFNAAEVSIPGTVTMDGGSHHTGTNQNGGGSGGSILIWASRINLSGVLSANGGYGDVGTVRAGGAGGGGGGRIKIFRDESISDTSLASVNGGAGSPGGTNGGSYSPGSDGTPGTTHIGSFSSNEPTSIISSKERRHKRYANDEDGEDEEEDEDEENEEDD